MNGQLWQTPLASAGIESLGPAMAHARRSPDLLERWSPVAEDIYLRGLARALPFPLTNCTAPGPRFLGSDPLGHARQGVNFASADHLNLSSHPKVVRAAAAALDQFGPHAGGTLDRVGRSANALALEAALAVHAGFAKAALFPSGWNALYAMVRMLVRPGDHVIHPAGLHSGLIEGIAASGATAHRLQGPVGTDVPRLLEDLRSADADAGILLILESLSGSDSTAPDLAGLQDLAHDCRATLLLDVTADFGAMGPRGLGALEQQDLSGCVDVIVGDLSRVFAANAGFAASNHEALCYALHHGAATCSIGSLAPLQVATATEALAIVTSDDGALRRARLAQNVDQLRQALDQAGFSPLGDAGPAVLLPTAGAALSALQATAALQEAGGFALLQQAPAGADIWQFLVMADHRPQDIADLIAALRSLPEAKRQALPGRSLS